MRFRAVSYLLEAALLAACTSCVWGQMEYPCYPCHCYHRPDGLSGQEVHVADCSSLSLTRVPAMRSAANIEVLNLTNNEFSTMAKQMIEPFVNITTLILTNNHVTRLCDEEIGGSRLMNLYLDMNTLDLSLEEEPPCLELLQQLNYLKLDGRNLRNDSLRIFPSLQKLELTVFGTLPEYLLYPLTELDSVHLKLPSATSLPDGLFQSASLAETLKAVTLEGRNLVIRDGRLFLMAERLSYVHLILFNSALPYDIFYFDHDREDHNKYRYHLRSLVIEGVQDIPDNVLQYAPYLRNLELRQCGSIPDGLLNNSTGLWNLTITDSNLDAIPAVLLTPLTRLKHLDLSRNRIKRIKENDFPNENRLQTVNLSSNQISRIALQSLEPLARTVLELDLSNNSVCLTSSALSGFRELKSLHLNMSCTDSFHSIIDQDLDSLEVLEITLADLDAVPRDLFDSLPTLQTFRLNGLTFTSVTDIRYGTLLNDAVVPEDDRYDVLSRLDVTTPPGKQHIFVGDDTDICPCPRVLVVGVGITSRGDLDTTNAVCVRPERIVDIYNRSKSCVQHDDRRSTPNQIIQTSTSASPMAPTARAVTYERATEDNLSQPTDPVVRQESGTDGTVVPSEPTVIPSSSSTSSIAESTSESTTEKSVSKTPGTADGPTQPLGGVTETVSSPSTAATTTRTTPGVSSVQTSHQSDQYTAEEHQTSSMPGSTTGPSRTSPSRTSPFRTSPTSSKLTPPPTSSTTSAPSSTKPSTTTSTTTPIARPAPPPKGLPSNWPPPTTRNGKPTNTHMMLIYILPVCFALAVIAAVGFVVRMVKRRKRRERRRRRQEQRFNSAYVLLSPYTSPFMYSPYSTTPKTPGSKYNPAIPRRSLEFDEA